MAVLHATDKGHEHILDVALRAATAASNFYVALLNDTILGTDNWADVSANEVTVGSNPGYAQQTINRDGTASGWPTLALDVAEMQIIGKQCTFTATANWATAVTAVGIVANLATDALLLYSNISSISLLSGESILVTPKWKLTKV